MGGKGRIKEKGLGGISEGRGRKGMGGEMREGEGK